MLPQKPRTGPNFSASIAIGIWSFIALLTTQCRAIPTFLLLAVAFGVGFALSCVQVTIRKTWRQHLTQPSLVWFATTLVLVTSLPAYTCAFKNAPPIHVDLIYYLWPIITILLGNFLPGERFRWAHLAGATVGFSGITLLIHRDHGLAINERFWVGYAFALTAALCWSCYVIFSRYFQKSPSTMIGIASGPAALLLYLGHLLFESPIYLTTHDFLLLGIIGAGTTGFSFSLWDHGVKQGSVWFLTVLSFLVPINSVLLLVIFGYGVASWHLAVALLLVVIGIAIPTGYRKTHPVTH